jgi:hypothetical protein
MRWHQAKRRCRPQGLHRRFAFSGLICLFQVLTLLRLAGQMVRVALAEFYIWTFAAAF